MRISRPYHEHFAIRSYLSDRGKKEINGQNRTDLFDPYLPDMTIELAPIASTVSR